VRPADRRRHAKCWPEYHRASRPVHPPGARYRPPVSAHPRRQEDAAQSTWLALCQTPIRSVTHDVSRMAGHHDAPILRRGHPPPTPRIPRLELDRYLRPDGRGTRASRRRGHETRYGSAASGHHSTTRAGTTPHPAAIRSCQSRIYADQPQHAYAHRKHRTHPRPGPSPTTNPSPRPRVAVHTTTAANPSWRGRQQGRHRHVL